MVCHFSLFTFITFSLIRVLLQVTTIKLIFAIHNIYSRTNRRRRTNMDLVMKLDHTQKITTMDLMMEKMIWQSTQIQKASREFCWWASGDRASLQYRKWFSTKCPQMKLSFWRVQTKLLKMKFPIHHLFNFKSGTFLVKWISLTPTLIVKWYLGDVVSNLFANIMWPNL